MKSVTQDIALIKHFREHLAVLSDATLLDLLMLASVEPVTNSEARKLLKLGRNRAWVNLSSLVRVGMLEKRGQSYRASPYAENLLAALSLTFQSVLAGKMPKMPGPAWSQVLHLASEGVETSYSRGRMDQAEYSRQVKLLKELEGELDGP